jgi:hypothetical protein
MSLIDLSVRSVILIGSRCWNPNCEVNGMLTLFNWKSAVFLCWNMGKWTGEALFNHRLYFVYGLPRQLPRLAVIDWIGDRHLTIDMTVLQSSTPRHIIHERLRITNHANYHSFCLSFSLFPPFCFFARYISFTYRYSDPNYGDFTVLHYPGTIYGRTTYLAFLLLYYCRNGLYEHLGLYLTTSGKLEAIVLFFQEDIHYCLEVFWHLAMNDAQSAYAASNIPFS